MIKLNDMKKVVMWMFLLMIVAIVIGNMGCVRTVEKKAKLRHKLMKEIVINHSVTDSAYRYYGYYKEVFFVYNYTYKDSTFHDIRIDDNHGIDFYLNEYGDTIEKTYVDYTNYPRRED